MWSIITVCTESWSKSTAPTHTPASNQTVLTQLYQADVFFLFLSEDTVIVGNSSLERRRSPGSWHRTMGNEDTVPVFWLSTIFSKVQIQVLSSATSVSFAFDRLDFFIFIFCTLTRDFDSNYVSVLSCVSKDQSVQSFCTDNFVDTFSFWMFEFWFLENINLPAKWPPGSFLGLTAAENKLQVVWKGS